jgi:Na+-transporting NADH:ubiquinone oxidoreductase subunit B
MIGGAVLLLTGIASWRIVGGVFLGMFLFSTLLNTSEWRSQADYP